MKSTSSFSFVSRKELYDIIKSTNSAAKFKEEFGYNYTNASNITLASFCEEIKLQKDSKDSSAHKTSKTRKTKSKKCNKDDNEAFIDSMLEANVDVKLLAFAFSNLVIKLMNLKIIDKASAKDIIEIAYGKRI